MTSVSCMAVKKSAGHRGFVEDNMQRIDGYDKLMAAEVFVFANELGGPYEVIVAPHSPDALDISGIAGELVKAYVTLCLWELEGKKSFMKECYSSGRPIPRQLNWYASEHGHPAACMLSNLH